MSKTTGRPRPACFHQAGHCVARWYLGFETDLSEVFDHRKPHGVTLGGDKSNVFPSGGKTVGPSIMFAEPRAIHRDLADEIVAAHVRVGEVHAEMALMTVAAGIVAEAKVRHGSITTVYLVSELDREIAARVVEHWLPQGDQAIDVAIDRASAMMRAGPTWTAVTRLADRLQRHGQVVDSEIDECCEFAFGREKPFTQDWTALWPVKLDLFRQGFVVPDPTTSMAAGPALPALGARPN